MASQVFDGSFDGVVTPCQNLFLGIKIRIMSLWIPHSLPDAIFRQQNSGFCSITLSAFVIY